MLYDILDVFNFAHCILLGMLGLKVINVIGLVVSGFGIRVTLAPQEFGNLPSALFLLYTMCEAEYLALYALSQSKVLKC